MAIIHFWRLQKFVQDSRKLNLSYPFPFLHSLASTTLSLKDGHTRELGDQCLLNKVNHLTNKSMSYALF